MPGHVQLNDGDNTLVRPKVGKLIDLLFSFFSIFGIKFIERFVDF